MIPGTPALRQAIEEARAKNSAIAHFNIAELATLRAIVRVMRDLRARGSETPVIIGVSEGEREFIGVKQAAALIRSLREEGLPIFLNADHTHSVEKGKEAADAGFDAVLFDGGKLPWEQNVAQTRQVADYARSVNPEIVVEGELGYIGSSSEIRDALPENAAIRDEDLTAPGEAQEFVRVTAVDLLAPAVGNIHGMFANAPEPALAIERIGQIAKSAGVPLVLHGASGNTADDIRAAIQEGVRIVHVSTELRVAWRAGLESALAAAPKEVAPYKLLGRAVAAVENVVREKLKIVSGA